MLALADTERAEDLLIFAPTFVWELRGQSRNQQFAPAELPRQGAQNGAGFLFVFAPADDEKRPGSSGGGFVSTLLLPFLRSLGQIRFARFFVYGHTG